MLFCSIYLHNYFQAAENAGNRLTDNERKAVITECNNQLRWLESNPDATLSDLEQHLKTAQTVCQSAMMKLHGASGPSYARPVSSSGPRVEEID